MSVFPYRGPFNGAFRDKMLVIYKRYIKNTQYQGELQQLQGSSYAPIGGGIYLIMSKLY